ncbi:class I SAM-dependent methyltransferase [Abyssogena phaseoliformis symbiont]|uniref:class I SAM-dependent methyltransferase n=1 Tax=Abyssogena phaseoliformis symbiont TaxID=596095 RepID=UPI001915E925|nr:class I SAM-dependent methyltransferase [Abyssogena phaseoliformis symbiont]
MNTRDIFESNLAAIETLKKVENRVGFATEEEKLVMIKFQGSGGCSQAFYRNSDKTGTEKNWELEAEALVDVLTDGEYQEQEARKSVLNAFFTPKDIIDNVFDFLPKIGNKKLEIYELGCGIGNFLSLMPDDFEFSSYTVLEKDDISARIAGAIYKENSDIKIINGDFEKDRSQKKYDLIIGNLPLW